MYWTVGIYECMHVCAQNVNAIRPIRIVFTSSPMRYVPAIIFYSQPDIYVLVDLEQYVMNPNTSRSCILGCINP